MSDRRMRGDDQGGPDGRAARDRALEIRRATERSALQLCGEVGYRRASVAAIVERSGSNLHRFYGTYAGKERCYAEAYARGVEDLCERLLSGCTEAPDWIAGMRSALLRLTEFVDDDRAFAAGLIAEVHVAGGAALATREAVVGRLSSAVDRAREDERSFGDQPPDVTSVFVVEAIEATVIRALAARRPIGEILPGLLFIAVACYFGPPAARRAVRELPGGA